MSLFAKHYINADHDSADYRVCPSLHPARIVEIRSKNGVIIAYVCDVCLQDARSALKIDFVLRGKSLPGAERVVEIFFTAPRPSTRVLSSVILRTDHRSYPLATNVDSRGVVKSVMSLEIPRRTNVAALAD